MFCSSFVLKRTHICFSYNLCVSKLSLKFISFILKVQNHWFNMFIRSWEKGKRSLWGKLTGSKTKNVIFHFAFSSFLSYSIACLVALRPAEQLQMFLQKPAETPSRSSGETRYPSKLGVVTNSIFTRWEQGGWVTQPFPLTCIEERRTKMLWGAYKCREDTLLITGIRYDFSWVVMW